MFKNTEMTASLSGDQQAQIVSTTKHCIQQASVYAQCKVPDIRIRFDLEGATAGQYRVRNGCAEIRYNPYIFAKYFEDNLANTVPHEVAHYLADLIYGARNIKPHGVEWRQIMGVLGAPALRSHGYDLSGIPQRRERRYTYRCNCREHQLSSTRHNRIKDGKTRYFCRLCSVELTDNPARPHENTKCINS